MRSSGVPIGAAAATAGVAAHVLRHWEAVGLLSPARVAGDRRRYGPEDLLRIRLIRRAKDAGLSLDAIRELLSGRDRDAVLRRHRAVLAERIARDTAALELLAHAENCPHDDLTACPHLRASLT